MEGFYVLRFSSFQILPSTMSPLSIRAENFYKGGYFPQVFNGAGAGFLTDMAFKVEREGVFPGFARKGAGFDFEQIEVAQGKYAQDS